MDPRLVEFAATQKQRERLQAWIEHGSQKKAAEALGCSDRRIRDARDSAERRAARQGYAPNHDMTHTAPPGYAVKGVSTCYNDDGQITQQWVKTNLDREQQYEALRQAVEALCEDVPRLEPVPAPKAADTALCNVYTLTDCHIGMMAWRKEGGDDWDTRIAEDTLIGCFGAMIAASPDAEECVIAQLGDFLHWDGLIPVTPTSGHILDADGRFAKMVEVAIRVLRAVVDMALAKHQRVILLLAEGNHDMASSVWLRKMFQALYENEPRVEVIDSELPYYAYQHGNVALFWHHSHLKRFEQIPMMMAAEFPVIWGNTTKRFAHTGDKHHKMEKDANGCDVIQHPTLAARDAYASRHGWHSLRRAMCITYHDEFGEVARNYVSPEMLR
jgi:hypothetical protein